MDDLILNFDSETENGNTVHIEAKFEPISDFEETRYGERSITYWHLINLKIKHSGCPHMFYGCGCYEPCDSEYETFESEARDLAAKEAA